MSYTAPTWVNGGPPAINAENLNALCGAVARLDADPVTKSYVDTALAGKQGNLTFDNTPTANSNNPVKSGGVKSYVDGHYVTAGQASGTTLGANATAEGFATTSSGGAAHAEGVSTTASAPNSHAEGYNTTASGAQAHAEGASTTAAGTDSHAEGFATEARGYCQHVFGMFNTRDPAGDDFDPSEKGTYIEIVGNGSSPSSRSNARTLGWNGNEWIAGTLTQASDARLKDVVGEVPDLSRVRAVRFKWNDKKGAHDELEHIGYLAQEVEKVAPYLVREDATGYKSLDYIALLCAKVEWLEARVRELEAR